MNSDFRDRISIAVWGVVFTLVVSAVISLPGQGSAIELVNRSLELPIAASALVPVFLALLSGSGAEAVIRAHPLAQESGLRWTVRLWALPIAVTLIAAVVLPRSPSVLYWAVAMLVFAGVLSGVLASLYFSLDTEAPGYRRARAALNLTCYAIALILFLLIPASWSEIGRALTLGGVAALLALELLRGTEGSPRSVALHALVIGVVVTQVAWALLLTGLSVLSTSLLLLLLFYLLVGLTWQTLLNRLTRRVALEFAAVGLAGLAIVLVLAP
jgi:hypothetical protein